MDLKTNVNFFSETHKKMAAKKIQPFLLKHCIERKPIESHNDDLSVV